MPMPLTDACMQFFTVFFGETVVQDYNNIFFGISLIFSLWLLYRLFVYPIARLHDAAWDRDKGRKR